MSSSRLAKCLPTQLYGPYENGMNAAEFCPSSGVSHRSGLKVSAPRG